MNAMRQENLLLINRKYMISEYVVNLGLWSGYHLCFSRWRLGLNPDWGSEILLISTLKHP